MFLAKIIWFSVLYGVTLGDEIKKDLDWWQTSIIYQVYPRSFQDSDGDGIGDLKGIEQRAEYFKWLGVGAVWLNPIFDSPMVDFGYDIKNFTDIYFKFGTIEDLKSLAKTLEKLGIKLILDFVPNHTSDESEWFQKSIRKIEPYTDYYVWKDPRAWENGHPVPPNNWISAFNIVPAWTYNEERKQFYLHNFHYKMPDLNYRSLQVQKEMESILLFWLEAGVDGFRIDSVPYLVENANFPDEAYYDEKAPKNEYDNLVHSYTKDQPETYEILRKWRMLFDNFTEFHKTETRLFLTEAYTSLEATMRYYGTKDQPISHVPFNFELIVKLSPGSTALEYADVIHKWLNDMPQGMWPNWVIGNHDRKRVATIFGEEMVDVLNMLVTMLPGTAVNYYGDEFGMSNGFVRWDQTVDPQGLILGEEDYQKGSRDGCRTPMQWDNTTYAGFTKGNYTWLPLNANYWKLNLKAQNESETSHLKLYKLLSTARQYPTIQKGETHIFTPDNWTIIIERALHDHPTFIIVLNIGSEESKPDLSDSVMKLPKEAFVYAASTNSIHKRGEKLVFGSNSFSMRPKSGIIFSTELSHVSTGNIITGLNVLCILCISLVLSQQFYV